MLSLYNVFYLILFILKRNRIWLSLWLLGLLVLSTFFAPMIVDVVGDDAAQTVLKEMLSSPAMIALCGLAYGDTYTYGTMYSQFMLVWCILAVAVMNIMFVVRHTRKDEEEGRLELIAALPVGRNANLLGTLVVALGANLLLAVLTGLIIAAFGVQGIDLAGSMVLGFALGANGFFFAALTALFAQLFSTAKAVTGVAMAALGAGYLLRAAGDVGSETLALISPLGLVERSQIYLHNYLWPELIIIVVSLAICVLAFALSSLRSTGQGMLPARNGRMHASVFLRGPLGLAWRLTRGTILAWMVVVFVFAASYGSIFNDMGSFIESNELYQVMFDTGASADDILNPVIAMLMLIMALIAAIPVAQISLKLKSEENRCHMEQLLATSVSRVYLIGCYLLLSVALAFVLMLLTALGMWTATYAVMSDPIDLMVFLKTAINLLPAVLVFAALGVFFVGLAPKASVIIWIYLAYSFMATYLAGILDLPRWAEQVSVFGLLPRYPADSFEPLVAIGLCVVALVLMLIGILGYRRRDIKA